MKTITLLIATLLMIATSARALAQEVGDKGGGTAAAGECAPLEQFRGAPVDLGCEETQASITSAAASPYSVVQLDRFEKESDYDPTKAGSKQAPESKGSKGEQ